MTDFLNRAWRKIDSSIDSLFMSRHVADRERPRIRFFLYVVLVSIVLFGVFFFLDLGTISSFRIMMIFAAGTGQAISLLALKYCADHKIAFRGSALVLLGYFLFLLGVGGPHGTRSFWMLVFPVYTFLLFGGREGLLWTTAGFLGSAYVLFDPYGILASFPYEHETTTRFLITYALLGIVARVFEGITYRSQEDIARKSTARLEEAILQLRTEIEERKKAESELKEAKDFAEAVLDSLPGTFFVIGDRLELIRWNKNFADVSGLTAEELRGKHCLELIDENDRDAVAHGIEKALAYGAASIEAKTLTKSGESIPFLFNGVWRTLGDGRYLLGTGMDISGRIKAEESLRRSEGLFRLAFETTPDAVAITGVESGIFVDVNQGFSEIVGYSKEEVVGKSSRDLKIWADPHVREEVIRGIVTNRVARNREVRLRIKGGEAITGLFSGGILKLGEESFLLSAVRDITDIKRAEEERLRLERQVHHTQKLESLGVLAGGIAHDFNNILTSILGNADLGLMRISPMAPARKNIEEIKKGALRAAGLSNQMLAYSGKGRFELKAIDLSSLLMTINFFFSWEEVV